MVTRFKPPSRHTRSANRKMASECEGLRTGNGEVRDGGDEKTVWWNENRMEKSKASRVCIESSLVDGVQFTC